MTICRTDHVHCAPYNLISPTAQASRAHISFLNNNPETSILLCRHVRNMFKAIDTASAVQHLHMPQMCVWRISFV